MTLNINGTPFPQSLIDRGTYKFTPPELRENGQGQAFAAGSQDATLEYEVMEEADWNWLKSFLPAGQHSATVTCRLWDEDFVERDFTSAELWEPVAEGGFAANAYQKVKVQFKALAPLV